MKVVYQDGDTPDDVRAKLRTAERSALDAYHASDVQIPPKIPLCIEMYYDQFKPFVDMLEGSMEQHFVVVEREFLGVPIYLTRRVTNHSKF
jgi:hypothetical protein